MTTIGTTETKSAGEVLQQAAELLENSLSFNFKSAGVEKVCEITSLPAETIAVLLDYGCRKLNDTVNSMYASPANEQSRAQLVEIVWKRALEGKLGERRAPAGNTGLRQYIITWLRARGISAKALSQFSGATPRAIINTVFAKNTEAERDSILERLEKDFQETQEKLRQSLGNIEIDF